MLALPRLVSLAETIAEDLLEGGIVTLTGQPSSGRSSVLDLVDGALDGLVSVVRISGGDNSASLSADLDALEAAVDSAGSAVCLIDDFGRALATPHGVAFQGRLHALAASGPKAGDVGVLLVGRLNESLTRYASQAPGSPLAAAAHRNAEVGALHAAEIRTALVADGVPESTAANLVEVYGGHLGLIAAARASASGRAGDDELERAVFRGVAETTGVTEDRLLDLARKPGIDQATSSVDDLLAPLVFHPEPGRTKLGAALVSRGLPSLLVAGQPSWPNELRRSVRRFRCRLEGMFHPIWADRHLGSNMRQFNAFLDALASRDCDLDLRLLGSDAGVAGMPIPAKAAFDRRLVAWATAGLRIKWRVADPADYALLHQRQLVSPIRLAGYALPPCDRITCVVTHSNDSDSLLPRARIALLEAAWSRASPYAG